MSKLDDYHWNEVLYGTHTVIDAFYKDVIDGLVMCENKKLMTLAEEVADKLSALFQAIGNARPK